jgi:hypothetical protein
MRTLQISLLLAAVGAAVILLRLFGDVASFAGIFAIIAGTVLAAPYAPPPGAPGRGWWTMLAAGAVITTISAGVSFAAETAGGLGALVGCVLVVIAVALGFPASSRART